MATHDFKGITILPENPSHLFQITGVAGRGAFGAVVKARNKETNETVAVKMLNIGNLEDSVEDARREVAILKDCCHPNIVRYMGTYREKDELWITMEYCEAGSVEKVFTTLGHPLREEEIAAICRGVLEALAYIHAMPALHRDVKSGNIFLTKDGQVRLGDFGVSAQLVSMLSRRNSFAGTTHWMAPEVIQEKEYDGRADVWSLGITAIEMAEMGPPMHHVHAMRVVQVIQRNPPPRLTNPALWSDTFNDFIAKCLVHNAASRPTAVQLLEHPFVRDANVSVLRELVTDHLEKLEDDETEKQDRPFDDTGSTYDGFGDSEDAGTIVDHDDSASAVGAADVPQFLAGAPPCAVPTIQSSEDAVPLPLLSLDAMPVSVLCSPMPRQLVRRVANPRDDSSSRDACLDMKAVAAMLGAPRGGGEGAVDSFPIDVEQALTPTMCTLLKLYHEHREVLTDTSEYVLSKKQLQHSRDNLEKLGITLRSILKM
eukprot:PhM_4_TR11166/c0_g1_i1/m.3027